MQYTCEVETTLMKRSENILAGLIRGNKRKEFNCLVCICISQQLAESFGRLYRVCTSRLGVLLTISFARAQNHFPRHYLSRPLYVVGGQQQGFSTGRLLYIIPPGHGNSNIQKATLVLYTKRVAQDHIGTFDKYMGKMVLADLRFHAVSGCTDRGKCFHVISYAETTV